MSEPSSIIATCASHETLKAYVLGRLSAERDAATGRHVEGCPRCLAVLDTLAVGEDLLVRRLVQPVDDSTPFHDGSQRRFGARVLELTEGIPASLRVGEYEVLGPLGRGAMGEVYRAVHRSLQRPVALKLLPDGWMQDARAIARFRKGVRAAGNLRHANVVEAFDASEVDGVHYLAMELVEGFDVAELVQRCGVLCIADACEIVRQAAEGLQHGHQAGCIHRDVKPSNILVSTAGTVKIADFGLALLVSPEFDSAAPGESATQVGMLLGTPDYMAPEQFQDPHGVDARADVYALGCTFYKLLVGAAPFESSEPSSFLEKMQAHAFREPPKLDKLRDDVPAGLLAVIQKMLAKNRERRFGTAADVAVQVSAFCSGSDLKKLVAHAGVTAPGGAVARGTTPAEWRRSSPRRGWSWFAGAVSLGAVAVAVCASVLTGPRSNEPSADSGPAANPERQQKVAAFEDSREWIVDDGDPQFRTVNEPASKGWTASKIGAGYRDSHTYNDRGALRATWTFANLPPGRYLVYATWPALDPAACARQVVYQMEGGEGPPVKVTVNQKSAPDDEQAHGCGWKRLGSIAVRNSLLTVEVDGAKTRGPGQARLDAVRVVRDAHPGS